MTKMTTRSRTLKRSLLLITIAVVSGVITISPKTIAGEKAASTQDKSPLRKEAIPWSKKMHELYKTLADLLTDVTSDKRFQDRGNDYRIENEANKLAALAHDLNRKGMVSVDTDPTIKIVAELLGKETSRAATELKHGNRAYARTILRSVPNYCMTCHTRNATGVQFAELPLEPTSKSMTPSERGEFYAASRQFDRAQSEFLSVVRDPKAAKAFNFNWEKAVRQSLAIAIRVKQDPTQAQEIVQAVLDMKAAPASIREDAKIWRTSIQEWQEELPRQIKTEEGLKAEAVRLMARAREVQKYPMDRTADVVYLRASAAVHDLLQTAPQGKYVGEGLLLAGLSYEVLSPLRMEDLHDLYYEACVRRAPHTSTAEMCYRRFEESMFLGYAGNPGSDSDIPEDVRERILELRSLSQPMPTIQN